MARKERQGYVYVLHFFRPISHARHYIGCTTDIKARLTTHAQGRGANLVRVALAQGIGFRLAALGVCSMTCMRRLERQLKNWHGAEEHCECCKADDARRIPGTQPYNLELLPFSLYSEHLWPPAEGYPRVDVRFATEKDPIRLSRDIAKLMQENKHALGWIPAGGSGGMTRDIAAGKVVVAMQGEALVGYCTFTETDEEIHVHQCCTADHLRGCGIGREMLQLIDTSRQWKKTMTARVREDLAANGFWERVGFVRCGTDTHETSASQLNIYRKENAQ